MTEASSPGRRFMRVAALSDDIDGPRGRAQPKWHKIFLAALAETSDVASAADTAQITVALAYRARRTDPIFAREWRAAISEGYEHLELETLQRLRNGTGKDDPKFDFANTLRFLALHRDATARERQGHEEHDEEAILASLDAKLDQMRTREENVTRLLSDSGVNAPRLSGVDE